MGIILDIVVIGILALSIFMGYKKGLIKVVFNLLSFFIAIILTWILFTPVTNLVVENTSLDENIKNVIIEKGVVEEIEDESKEGDSSKSEYIEKYVAKTINDKKNEIIKGVADVIAEKTVAIIVAIGLFIAIRLVLIILKFVVNGLAELPVIKQFNELGGTAYGVIRGIFVIYLLFAICFIIMSVNNIEAVSNLIDSSIISKFIYEHNIILNIIF